MADLAYVPLKAEADPAWLYAHLGFTSDNAYGYRTEEDGSHVLVVRTADMERALDAAEGYDALYLEHALKPSAVDRLRAIRKERMASMPLGPGRLALDDVTLSRLHQASSLLDKAADLAEIAWEVVPGSFVTWPADQVQAVALGAGLHVQACFRYQRDQTATVRAAPSAEALAVIAIDTGWPGE